MRCRSLVPWPVCAAAIAIVLATPSPPATAAQPHPLPLFAEGALKRALALAVERLARAECRAVYEDFRAADGATLGERLRRDGVEPAEHLLSLAWRNGAAHPRCANPRVFLVTRVGGREVLVCPAQFGDLAFRKPAQAAGLLVHEQLHALGLGENPPASEDISRRVFVRCGG